MVFESMYYPRSVFCEHMHDIAFYRHDGWCTCFGMQSHYGMHGVHTYMLAIAQRSIMVSGMSFGCDVYRENQITGSFGFNILPDLRAGIGISMLNYWIEDLYNRYGYAVHLSTCYNLGALKINGWLNNLNVPRFNETDVVPMIYAIRAQYVIQDNFACVIAARGTHERLPFFNAGISWAMHKYLEIGFGANTDPLYFEYMLCLPLGHVGIRYTGTLHEYLGPSHAMLVTFNP
jgi:hypothetical protein